MKLKRKRQEAKIMLNIQLFLNLSFNGNTTEELYWRYTEFNMISVLLLKLLNLNEPTLKM